MSARARLAGIERQIRRTFGGEPSEEEVRRWQRRVEEWVEFRAGLRFPTPPFLDEPPPPELPHPPTGSDEQDWRDALEAVANFSARVARRIGPLDYLPDTSARAKGLCELHAARWRVALVGRDEPLPWFFSEAPPTFPRDEESAALLDAVVLWSVSWGETDADNDACRELFARASERARRSN
jgi:hypothetical protein